MYFNLDRDVFQSLEFKEEIHKLFNEYWFFEISREIGEIKQIPIKKEVDIFIPPHLILTFF
jgi:hypothetical protein